MSEAIAVIYSDGAAVHVTSFHGGVDRGCCLQLSITGAGFVQLTEAQVLELQHGLATWLMALHEGRAMRKAGGL